MHLVVFWKKDFDRYKLNATYKNWENCTCWNIVFYLIIPNPLLFDYINYSNCLITEENIDTVEMSEILWKSENQFDKLINLIKLYFDGVLYFKEFKAWLKWKGEKKKGKKWKEVK